MLKELNECKLCPHNCKINRNKGEVGRCKATDKIKIALYSKHLYEEPCISGEKGSGTIFFSNCNLNCVFCQNYEISQERNGKEITIENLSEIFIEQQKDKAHNINLVTPTSYVPQIIEAIKIARKKGLNIPIIYNTNGYENIETIKILDGYVDVYLPDLKYAINDVAKKYSKIDNYFEIATRNIIEMIKQVGKPTFDENGIIKKGVIIRHLVLPNNMENSKMVLEWLSENIPKDIYISIMAQYFPTYKAKEIEEINRKITKDEWNLIEKYINELGIENGFIQELRRT